MQVQVGKFRFNAQQVRSHPESVNEALLKAKRELGHAYCHCNAGGQALKLVIRERNGNCLLAVWPEDGPNHHRDCPFHRASDALSGVRGYRKDALEETVDGFNIKPGIALSRRRDELRQGMDDRCPPATEVRVTRARMSLLAIMHYLWEQADQNRWHRGWKRDYGRLHWSLRQVIEHGRMGRHQLGDLVYIPPRFNPKLVREINEAWSKWKTLYQQQEGSKIIRTGLVLAEIQSITPTKHGFGIKLAHHGEMIFCSETVRNALARRYARALAAVGRRAPGTSCVGLLAAEVSAKGNVNVVDGSLMLTTDSYIPVDSSHEALLACHLVAGDRCFIKPLHYDAEDHLLPDFVLTDTGVSDTYLEVFGMNTPEYVQRKREKLRLYADQGKRLWSWEAHAEAVWPALPIPS